MKDQIQSFGNKLWRDFRSFSPGQKAVTIAAVLALAIGGYVFSSYVSKPSYAPLFTNLAASDASAIVDKLQADHKQYKLSEGGTAILVPSKDVYALRLTMSSAGLPSSGQTGYSLLDKEGVTTSEFKQRVDYQRALEGELSNTINAIDGVQAAQVHLAMPAQDVFSDDSQKTTAAVLITTIPGQDLSSDQVRSIVNLVSSSVPGLTADQVTVSDATGKVLASAGSGIASGGTSTQNEATQTFDTQLAAKVQAMLDRVLGTGHSSVTVNAALDFDSKTINSRVYTNSGAGPLSQSGTSETYGKPAGSTGTGGVLGDSSTAQQQNTTPGAATTTTSAAGATAAAGSSAGTSGTSGTAGAASSSSSGTVPYAKTSDTRDNAVNTTEETRVAAPGAITQLGVSVVLDAATAKNISQAQIKSLVTSAAGINVKRGDLLTVAALPFSTADATAAAKAAADAKKQAAATAASKKMAGMIKTGGIVLAIIVLGIITMIMSKRRKKGANDSTDAPDELDALLAALNERAGSEGVPAEPAMRKLPANGDSAASDAQRRAVADLAGEQPDDMARLLRSWMNTKDN